MSRRDFGTHKEQHNDTNETVRGSQSRASLDLEHARATLKQLRQLLEDRRLADQPELRLSLADELLREIEALGLKLHRPTVRQTAARVRRAVGLPSADGAGVTMPVETALAFLSLAIEPLAEDHALDQRAG